MARAGRKARSDGKAVARMLPGKVEAVPAVDERGLATVDPQALISQAIAKGLPIETMERLLAMRRELKAEWARERYFSALSKFQSECPNILKAREVKGKDGKHRYSYAPLDFIIGEVKEALERNGFSYTIIPSQTEKAVTSVCHAHHVDGHEETSAFTIPMDPAAYMNDSQKIASAMTYGKRYAFCNAFGIMTTDVDDDANATGEPGNGKAALTEPKAQGPGAEFAEAEAKLKATESKLDAALKPMAEERKAQDATLETAKAEATAVYKDAVNSNKTLKRPYSPDELSAMVKAAVIARDAGDIEKLRSLAIDWTVDLDARKKGE